jgi:peptidyl-tRNA hydrolase, PTH1 family
MKYLIFGLGNIGPQYANTRHNVGFTVLDELAARHKVSFAQDRYAYNADFRLKGRLFKLFKPTTFMNLSGNAVLYWMRKEQVDAADMLIIADDLDLMPGILRMRPKGSGGSHNGLNHIIEKLEHNQFARLRFGIGNQFVKGYQADFVLSAWDKDEQEMLKDRIPIAADMVESFGLAGITNTMNAFNNK